MSEELKRKLCSRKLWAAAAGFVTGVMALLGSPDGSAEKVSALILSAASVVAYVIGEGLTDAAH